MAQLLSYGISSERLGGLKRARSAFRDNYGRFLSSFGFFAFEDIRERLFCVCGGMA
jgi:hypothetical protein